MNDRFVSDPSVVVQDVFKTYEVMSTSVRSGFGRKKVEALRGVSFVAERGEAVGFVGRNGSGKSTLMRLISGEENASQGRILVSEKPSMLGVSPALQQYLSGGQNIYLGLLALGESKTEAARKVPEIADWAGLVEAIDRPLNTYSSGMRAKLGFAVATSRNPDILLVDEALSTGDAAFADKAKQRMQELLDRAGNLFLVSHSVKEICDNCPRTIWIHKGEIVADGPSEEVTKHYTMWSTLENHGKDGESLSYLEDYRSLYAKPVIELS